MVTADTSTADRQKRSRTGSKPDLTRRHSGGYDRASDVYTDTSSTGPPSQNDRLKYFENTTFAGRVLRVYV